MDAPIEWFVAAVKAQVVGLPLDDEQPDKGDQQDHDDAPKHFATAIGFCNQDSGQWSGQARTPHEKARGKRAPRKDGSAAIEIGVKFLLAIDPATATYPMGWGNTRPNNSWFKLGFPSGYVADVLQVLEAVCELGYAGDQRLDHAFEWLLSRRDRQDRWRNEYSYHGKMWDDIDRQGQPSKWVTLRACRVLKLRGQILD